jgi:hypothetical protein
MLAACRRCILGANRKSKAGRGHSTSPAGGRVRPLTGDLTPATLQLELCRTGPEASPVDFLRAGEGFPFSHQWPRKPPERQFPESSWREASSSIDCRVPLRSGLASALQVPEARRSVRSSADQVPCQPRDVLRAAHVPVITVLPVGLVSVQEPWTASGSPGRAWPIHLPRNVRAAPTVAVHSPLRIAGSGCSPARESSPHARARSAPPISPQTASDQTVRTLLLLPAQAMALLFSAGGTPPPCRLTGRRADESGS